MRSAQPVLESEKDLYPTSLELREIVHPVFQSDPPRLRRGRLGVKRSKFRQQDTCDCVDYIRISVDFSVCKFPAGVDAYVRIGRRACTSLRPDAVYLLMPNPAGGGYKVVANLFNDPIMGTTHSRREQKR